MYRNGYRDIVPFGKVRDRGRDAQISLYKGSDSNNFSRTFFQYSLEKNWEKKLKNEITKVDLYNHNITSFVFITSQNVSGEKRDKLDNEFRKKHNFQLIIFDREWLRLQLEEANKDLAQKYLGIPTELSLIIPREMMKPSVPIREQEQYAWQLFISGQYEEALPKLKYLLQISDDSDVWRGIAWCQYILFNYREALRAIEKSLSLEPESTESLSIKACILAESGISENSRPKLILSKEILLGLLKTEKSWILYYNLGNVLGGLKEYADAKEAYLKAIALNSEVAEIWSNLGNCLHHLREHEEELSCFDKAISLNPDLSQAFVSKANTLGKIYEKYEEAVEILDFAVARDSNVLYDFPYLWYWRANFLLKLNELVLALDSVEKGLKNSPDEPNLLDLKSHILSTLWREDASYLEYAKTFFKFRAYSDSNDYRPFIELAQIYEATDSIQEALESITNALNALSPMNEIESSVLMMLDITLEELVSSIIHISVYEEFRKTSPINISYVFDGVERVLLDVYKLSWICFLISFIDLFHFFVNHSSEEPQRDRSDKEIALFMLSAFKKAHLDISKDVIKISKLISLTYKDASQQDKIQILTVLITALPEFALVESSRQIGYLTGLFGVNSNILNRVQSRVFEKLEEWLNQISIEVVRIVNHEFQLLKDAE
jgi:tetratricopeptide (TPR) repeat protein